MDGWDAPSCPPTFRFQQSPHSLKQVNIHATAFAVVSLNILND
jgi:hypothetical protein